jgi:hypothetical protein
MTVLSPLRPPSDVTLSEAKGLSRWESRCFAEFTLSATNGLSMIGLPSCRALTVARYKRRILTTEKHAYNKSIAVLKNAMQNATYMHPIQ